MVAALAGCGDNGNAGSGERGAGERGQQRGQQHSTGTPAEWVQQVRANMATVQVPMEAVIPQAAAAAGGQTISVRLEESDAGPVYAADVLADTIIYTVRIDAVTDSVVSVGPSRRGGPRGGRSGQDRGRGGQDGDRNHASDRGGDH